MTILVSLVLLFFNNIHTVWNKESSRSEQCSLTTEKYTLKPFTTSDVYFKTKYILLWTNAKKSPFLYFGEGNTIFKNKNCKFINCHVTSNRRLLGHYREFEVIAFNGPQLMETYNNEDMPQARSPHQKYVYTNIEASINYPICSNTWDRYFNWTWTYKLNSDAVWGYMVVRNASNHIIGPSSNISWINEEYMAPVGDNIKAKLTNKSRAVAWFVSNCNTLSKREQYVTKLQHYISAYNVKVDVYGECGDFQCPRNEMEKCLEILQEHYYFYLAFENALSEDYVTEKLLHALNHYTVPVVYGGADYTKFLPPGSYLDALALGPQTLAEKIYEATERPELYYKYFRWRNYYSYHLKHETPDTDDYCKFCAMVNNDTLMNTSTTYNDFSAWWTTKTVCEAIINETQWPIII
ncbi:alpha-(1,3)-fucosyltransferase C-like [Anticarsia gemmatalis]|uniref:alpha-(1,3)-fucosyltransferase C-like n=1 Tax=Anticarsia gemmatalis TaxID=129554 RepID=UPI003F772F5D